jgi:DNA-binding XRE family transcriptional regulator
MCMGKCLVGYQIWDTKYGILSNKKWRTFYKSCYILNMEKADRLKILRLLNGFTQTELAAKAHLPQVSLAAIEKGKYAAAGETGMSIASVLGVPFEYLYSGTPSVDSSGPLVWVPTPPSRTQHLQTFNNDIRHLFSLFLDENCITTVISAELRDGSLAYLIARRIARDLASEEYNLLLREHKPPELPAILLSCLLLIPKVFTDSFKSAFNSTCIAISDNYKFNDASIENFGSEHLHEMLSEYMYHKANLDKIIAVLENIRKNKSASRNKLQPTIGYIFKIFSEQINKYDLPDVKLGILADYYVSKCEELGGLPKSKIDKSLLITEIAEKFESFGYAKTVNYLSTNPKLADESDEKDYLLIKEWFREFWMIAGSDEKDRLLDVFKKNFGYDSWVEKFEKGTAERKRAQLLD